MSQLLQQIPDILKLKNEIIKYTGVSAFSGQGTITGVTRAQDSTSAQNYVKGDLVQKYELGGVSLRRINRTHDFREVTDTNPITLDSYKIKLDMGEQGIGRSTSTVTSYPFYSWIKQNQLEVLIYMPLKICRLKSLPR